METTGNASFPLWVSSQTDLYFNATRQGSAPPQPTRTSLSLSAALPRNITSSVMRVVGCTVVGEDPQTKLPITVFAVSKIVPDGALPWEDFEYPIRTKPCTVAGCISSVTRNLNAAGGPGLLLSAGKAPNLAPPNGNVLFVRVQGSPMGLLRVVPVANATQNLTEAVYREASVTLPPSYLPGLTGWQADYGGSGAIYITGRMDSVGPGDSVPVIARFDDFDAFGPDGNYSLTAQVPRIIYRGPFTCIAAGSVTVSDLRFYDISSAWLHPVWGDLFVVDPRCKLVYRVENGLFTGCDTCKIHHVASFGGGVTGSSTLDVNKVGSIDAEPGRCRTQRRHVETYLDAPQNNAGVDRGRPGPRPPVRGVACVVPRRGLRLRHGGLHRVGRRHARVGAQHQQLWFHRRQRPR